MDEAPGLRERKKQRTRETIRRAAIELFGERGYHATTVADIAEAAEVAPSTVFVYFPTKDDIVFADWESYQTSVLERLTNRPEGETAFQALRDWANRVLRVTLKPSTEEQEILRQVVDSDEHLLAQERYHLEMLEDVLATAIARDLSVSPDAAIPHLAAGAALGAIATLMTYGRKEPTLDMVDQIETVLAFVEAGLAAITGGGVGSD